MNDLALIKLDAATHALAECKTAMEAKQIADIAEAARVYLERTQASVETVNRATEVRLLAERQMGEFLKKMPKNRGAEGIGKSVPPAGTDTPKTFAQIGVTEKQARVAQKLADIPADEFKARIALGKIEGEKLSTAKVLAFAGRTRAKPTLFNLAEWEKRARVQLATLLTAVPPSRREECVRFVQDFASRFSPQQQTKNNNEKPTPD